MNLDNLVNFFKSMNLKPSSIPSELLLFLFGLKPAVLFFSNSEDSQDIWDLKRQRIFLMVSLVRDFYFYDRINNEGYCYAIVLSDKKIPKDITFPKINNQKLGKFLGYPDCCVQQFEKDFDVKYKGGGVIDYQSAKRYLEQLKEMKIKKDPFEVKIYKNKEIGIDSICFIPCSPKCKKALRIQKNSQIVLKFLEDMIKIESLEQ